MAPASNAARKKSPDALRTRPVAASLCRPAKRPDLSDRHTALAFRNGPPADHFAPAGHRSQRHRHRVPIALALCGLVPGADYCPITMGEGLTPLVDQAGEGASPSQAGMDFTDWKLQGSWRHRHAVDAEAAGHRSDIGGQFRKRWRSHRGLCSSRRHAMENPGSCLHPTRQDSADAGLRCRDRVNPRHTAGHIGGSGTSSIRCLLREPRLASLLSPGTRTLAYELWEDFGFTSPDNIIIPTGGGSNVLGCDIGFCG